MHAGIIASPVGGSVAPIARQYFMGQALGEATNGDKATWQNHLSLTETLDNGATYAVFWSCELGHLVNTLNTTLARLTIGGVAAETVAFRPFNSPDLDAWFGTGGLAFVTGDGGEEVFEIDFRPNGLANDEVAQIRNARVVLLRLESGDEYVEDVGSQTNDTTSFLDAAQLDFTPATAGSYLVLASGVMNGFATNYGLLRLYDGANGTPEVGAAYITTADMIAGVVAWVRLGLSSAQSFRLQFRSSSTATTTVRGARVLALRLDGFTKAYAATAPSDADGGEDAYGEALALSRQIASNDFLTVGAWNVASLGTADAISARLSDPTGALNEDVAYPRPYGGLFGFVATIGAYLGGRRAWSLETKGPGGVDPQSTVIAGAVVAALQLN